MHSINWVLLIWLVVVPLVTADWGFVGWGNSVTNPGIHNRPVFRTEPQIHWGFNGTDSATDSGVIYVLDSDGSLFYTNGYSYGVGAAAWHLSANGTVIHTFNDTFYHNDTYSFYDGTVSYNKGIFYLLDDGHCTLYAIDTLNAYTVLWNYTEASPYCFEVSSAGSIIWSDDKSILYLPLVVGLRALNASTGQLIWGYNTTTPNTTASEYYYSFYLSPIRTVDNNFLLFDYASLLHKINMATGERIWTYQLNISRTNNDIRMPPAVDSAGNIYLFPRTSYVWSLFNNGTVRWVVNIMGYGFSGCSPLLINDNVFYVGENSVGHIFGFNTANGSAFIAWNNTDYLSTTGFLFSQLTWSNNVLYAPFINGILGAFDTTNNYNLELLWMTPRLPLATPSPDFSFSLAGPSIGLDGTIYLSTHDLSGGTNLIALGTPIPSSPSSSPSSSTPSPSSSPSSPTSPSSASANFVSALCVTVITFACLLV